MASRSTSETEEPKQPARQSRKQKRWSRTGCERCKRLHTKCDESKPSCLRCRRAAQTCSYNPPKTWLFDPVVSSRSSSSPAEPTLTIASPPARARLHPHAARNLEFFTIEANVASQGTTGTWDIPYTLLLYHSEPAFAHLLNAFTESMYALHHPAGPTSKYFYFASLDAAISLMRTGQLHRGDESFLHCCGLLTVCELLRTMNASEVMPHLDALDNILANWSSNEPSAARQEMLASFSRRVLALRRSHLVTFARAQARQISARAQALPVSAQGETQRPIPVALPAAPESPLVAIHSLEHALGCLRNLLINSTGITLARLTDSSWWSEASSQALDHASPRSRVDRETLTAGLLGWRRAFGAWMGRTMLGITEVRGARFLMAHHAIGMAAAELSEVALETERGSLRMDDLFGVVVGIVESLTQEGFRGMGGLGILALLFFVGMRCRNCRIRSKAVEMLREVEGDEMGWNGRVAALVANVAAGLERDGDAEHGVPFVRGLAAGWRAEAGQARGRLTFKYLDVRQRPTLKMTEEVLVEGEDYQACRRVEMSQWPLDTVVKTFGYACFKLMPYVFLQTEESVVAFLRAINAEEKAREEAVASTKLEG